MPQTFARLQKQKFTEKPAVLLPITLDGPRRSIRPFLFKSNSAKALKSSLIGISFHLFSLSLIYHALSLDNLYLLVFGWFLAGFSVTSLFVLGHDCAHSSFLKNNKLNDFLGHFFFLFSFYPYFAWKYSHNSHHANTNKLTSNASDVYFDNAWIPFTISEYLVLKKKHPLRAAVYKLSRYCPPIGSLLHNIIFHAFPDKFVSSHRRKVVFSIFVLGLGVMFLAIAFYLLTGVWFAFLHFLIMPALIFQFWMSYYTYLHHTSTDILFYEQTDWTPYKGQILSTYNFLTPSLISFFHFHIDIHTPHHVSTAIPCYHLREAYNDLKKSEFGKDIKEGKFSFTYLGHQIRNCHLWDEKANAYVKFSDVSRAGK